MQNLAEQEYYEETNPNLKLVKNDNIVRREREQYYLYYNSGIFPILLVIIFFLCIGIIFNIGLRIQNFSYDRTIHNLKQSINEEINRSDRLNLRISQLKSPSYVASAIEIKETVENEDAESLQDISAESTPEEKVNITQFKKLDILYSQTANNLNITETELNSDGTDHDDNNNDLAKGVDFKSVFDDAKDVLLVVSEGILTFFIP
jgi:cell division protein FtsL